MPPIIEKIANTHASLHIQPAHYIPLEHVMMGAFATCFGPEWTDEVDDAWRAAYWSMACMCSTREGELYQAAKWRGWKDFVLVDRVQEVEDVVSLHLRPKDGMNLHGTFKPGQYVSVQVFVPEHKCYQQRQ
jgi:nitric oxide dioxygenase